MTDKLTPETVRAALDAATPGPWTIDEESSPSWGKNFSILHNGNQMVEVAEMVRTEEDARLIAMAYDLATAYLAMAEENERLMDTLHSIDVYGSDTLSGRSDGPNDAAWYRDGVKEMRDRARAVCDRHVNTLEIEL